MKEHKITVLESILPLFTMIGAIIIGGLFFPIGGELLIVVMLLSASVAGLVARKYGHDWSDIQKSAGEKIARALPAIIILLSIGMLIGTWMFSGTIPFLVFYGIQVINPQYMILTAFLITAVMSLTGSSWAAAGTIGVALVGVAIAIDAPVAATAGAVVSGAYFGDKLSPLSDTTNVCAIGAGANLYDHIKNMIYTAGPSFILALIVYFIAGMTTDANTELVDPSENPLLNELDAIYNFNLLLLLPPLIVISGTIKRFEAALTMAISSLVAVIIGVTMHDFSVYNGLTSSITGFNVSMIEGITTNYSDPLLLLLNRGGVYSTSSTLVIIIAAFLLAGAMDVSGALEKLLYTMLKHVRSVFGLIAATMASGATVIALTSHASVTALIIGGLFQKAYKKQNLAPENLSRSMEDSVTILEPLMPWTVSAMFMASTLGVATIDYAPWAVFCYSGGFFSLLIAATYKHTNIGLKQLPESDKN